jgi:hypothetical protein
MNIEQRIYNGDRAKEILENEVFQQVFVDIEQELIESWKTAPARDVEGRESIFKYLTMLSKVKAQMVQTFETGKLAALELQHKKSWSERTTEAIGSVFAKP